MSEDTPDRGSWDTTEALTAILRCLTVLWFCVRIAPTVLSNVPALTHDPSFHGAAYFLLFAAAPTGLALCSWIQARTLAGLILSGVSSSEAVHGVEGDVVERRDLDVIALRLMAFLLLVRRSWGFAVVHSWSVIRGGLPFETTALVRLLSNGAMIAAFAAVLVFAPQIATGLRRLGGSEEATA